MLRDLLFAGRDLAGGLDARLWRGLLWSVGEALFTAAPYPVTALLLLDLMHGRTTALTALLTGLALLLCQIGRMVCAVRAMPALFGGAYATMARARLRLADHLRQLPMGWLGASRNGALAGALASDLQVVEDLWSHALGVLFGGLLVPAGLSLVLLGLDWRLGLVVLATLAAAFLLLAGGERVLARQGEKLLAVGTAANAELVEYAQGIAVVRGFGRFGTRRDRLHAALTAVYRAALRTDVWPAPLMGLFGFATEAGFTVALWVGADGLAAGRVGADTLLLFALLSLPVYRHLFEVGLAFLMLRYARQSLRRVRALLAVPPLPEPAAAVEPVGTAIRFDAVRFAYEGSAPLFDGLSLTIPAGCTTAVVGRSGCGKTTLVHLIARLWDVQGGAVTLGGTDVRAIGSDVLHRHIAMVFQDVTLFSGSVLDNLRVGRPGATLDEVRAAARAAQADDFIMTLPRGYDTLLGEDGGGLSGGERQRLSIARALLKDAPLILLDEATASVDPSAEAEVQRALSALVRGRTVVVIAHRLRNVRDADHILVLDGGRLVEEGTHDQLLARCGAYAALWVRQSGEPPR